MTQIQETGAREPAAMDWKTKWLAMGGMIGALLGVMAVYLYIRSVESESGAPATGPRPIRPGAAVQVALSILTAIKQFANLGTE